MTIEGVDYAWDRPSAAGLAAAGKRFAVRYGGPGSVGKQLDAAERDQLLAAGLSIVANAEGTANGLLGGRTAGVAWARSANDHFRQLGMPADRPIYLSVDFDAGQDDWPAIDAALRGAADVLGAARVGVYGGYDTIAHCAAAGTARWLWQTYAWSGGRWHDRAQLRQYRNHVSLAGGTVDLCQAMVDDYGQWGQRREADNMTQEEIAAAVVIGIHRALGMAVRRDTPTGRQLGDSITGLLEPVSSKVDALADQPAAAIDYDQLADAIVRRALTGGQA